MVLTVNDDETIVEEISNECAGNDPHLSFDLYGHQQVDLSYCTRASLSEGIGGLPPCCREPVARRLKYLQDEPTQRGDRITIEDWRLPIED